LYDYLYPDRRNRPLSPLQKERQSAYVKAIMQGGLHATLTFMRHNARRCSAGCAKRSESLPWKTAAFNGYSLAAAKAVKAITSNCRGRIVPASRSGIANTEQE